MYARILQHSFRRQRGRKWLAALAVTAGMAVTTTMLTLRVNLGDDLNAELRHIGANLVIAPASDSLPVSLNGVDLRPAGAGALLAEADLPRVEAIFWSNNLAALAPVLDLPATINGAAVTIEGTYFARAIEAPGGGRTVVTGVRQLYPSWSVAGDWPRDDAPEALAGAGLARRLSLTGGERITVRTTDGRAARLTITGVLTTGTAQDGELLTPLAIAQRLAAQPGKLRQVLVSAVTKPEDDFARRSPSTMSAADAERWMCSPYAVTIASQLQQAWPGAIVRVVRPMAESEGAILGQLRLLIWFLTGLALAAGGLAISGAMSASVIERRGEIALMKAMGAPDATIGALVLGEAAMLGTGGAVLGFFAGAAMASRMAVRVLGHPVAWKPALAPWILLLALAVVAAGSLHPLRQSLRLAPAAGLRGEAG